MACIRYIYTCSFILAVIAAHVIPFAEGRQLKALKKEKFNSFVDETGPSNHAKKTTQEKNIPAGKEVDFQVAPPTPSDDIVSGGEVTSPPTSTNKNHEFGTMLSSSTDDFKPTAPGNSPGVGHKVMEGEQDNQQNPSPADTPSSTSGGFKTRNPVCGSTGCGIGHKAIRDEQDDEQKPPPAHTLSSSPDDFKPTTPGRSPGVGHAFQTMKEEPNA